MEGPPPRPPLAAHHPPPPSYSFTQKAGRKMAYFTHPLTTEKNGRISVLTYPRMLESMSTATSPSVPSSFLGIEDNISLRSSALQLATPPWRPRTWSWHLALFNFDAISCPSPTGVVRSWLRVLASPWEVQMVLATIFRSILEDFTLTLSKWTTFVAVSSSKWTTGRVGFVRDAS